MYANASKAFDESRKALRIYQYNLARLEANAAKLYPKDWGCIKRDYRANVSSNFGKEGRTFFFENGKEGRTGGASL